MTLLATAATLYGVLGALSSLLQARALVRAGSAREISLSFISILAGGYAVWLAYGIALGNLPLVLTDAVGLASSCLTWTTAVRLRPRESQRPSHPATPS